MRLQPKLHSERDRFVAVVTGHSEQTVCGYVPPRILPVRSTWASYSVRRHYSHLHEVEVLIRQFPVGLVKIVL
jgi:hypothetical protein